MRNYEKWIFCIISTAVAILIGFRSFRVKKIGPLRGSASLLRFTLFYQIIVWQLSPELASSNTYFSDSYIKREISLTTFAAVWQFWRRAWSNKIFYNDIVISLVIININWYFSQCSMMLTLGCTLQFYLGWRNRLKGTIFLR